MKKKCKHFWVAGFKYNSEGDWADCDCIYCHANRVIPKKQWDKELVQAKIKIFEKFVDYFFAANSREDMRKKFKRFLKERKFVDIMDTYKYYQYMK
jgi:hypothetical protein